MIPRCQHLKLEAEVGLSLPFFSSGKDEPTMLTASHWWRWCTTALTALWPELISSVILHVIVKAVTKHCKHPVCFYRDIPWTLNPNGQNGGKMGEIKEVRNKNQVKASSVIKRNKDWFSTIEESLEKKETAEVCMQRVI